MSSAAFGRERWDRRGVLVPRSEIENKKFGIVAFLDSRFVLRIDLVLVITSSSPR